MASLPVKLPSSDDPYCVNNPWNVPKQREDYIDPELPANADLQKNAERGK